MVTTVDTQTQLTLLAAGIHALHYPAYADYERTPVCESCHGKAGTHPCGCWREDDNQPVCGHCSRRAYNGATAWVDWPCPTVQLVVDMDALTGGSEGRSNAPTL